MMITQTQHRCLIRESEAIRTAINLRMLKYKISAKEIVEKGRICNRTFSESQLSRYRKHGNIKGTLPAYDIIWLCKEFNIDLKINVKKKKKVKAEAGKLGLNQLI